MYSVQILNPVFKNITRKNFPEKSLAFLGKNSQYLKRPQHGSDREHLKKQGEHSTVYWNNLQKA